MSEVVDQRDRQRIAEDHASTLFVEAGAGSGKTSSLVSRVVTLVLGGADIASVAAITFTEAAAAELRARVRSTLEDVEAGHEVRWVHDSPEARQRAGEALDRLDRATICTLHAFAQRLLLAAPIEAELPPAIEVHDDISSALRFEDRWQRFERQLLDDDRSADVMRMALTLGIGSRDLQIIADTLGQNWDLVEEARDAGLVAADLAVDVDHRVLRPERWVAALDDVLSLATRCTAPDDDTLAAWLRDVARPLRHALAAAADDPHEVVLLVKSGPKRPHNRLGRKDQWVDDGKAAVVQAGRAVIDDMEAAVAAVTDQVLTRLGAEIAVHTLDDAAARRREGRLEFHDLLVLARQVLRTRRAVRQRFHRRYRHLLIDEFQDTDPIQVELAVRIAADPDHDPSVPWHDVDVAEGRLFFVGDPKQSIYRFRRADIDLFSRTAARYTAGATRLRVNFRTVEPVLDFCNAVFEALIRPESETLADGTIRTAQPPYVPLEPHRGPIEGDPGPAVVVLGDGEPHPSADAARQAEAADVAGVLRRAHDEGWLVAPAGAPRPCRWSDMAILLPSRTTLSHLRTRLDEADVPYRLESGTLVYGTTEVTDLLAILGAIDDPGDAISVVGALRSPAYGCGDDDLLRWTRAHGTPTYVGDAVRPDEVLAGLADGEVSRVEHALADLRRRHRDAPFRSVPQIVDAVVRDRRLMELCLAGGRHRDLWRLYRVVIEHARQFADTDDGGLRAFLRWARLQRDDKLRATSPVVPEADVDAVRILTIHGAKGLEFGITAVSGLSAEDPKQVRTASVAFRPGGGFDVRMRKGMETAKYETVRTLEETMDLHERTRLLYVALTRARDHLVVSSHHTKRGRGGSHGGRLSTRLDDLGDRLDGLAERWTLDGEGDGEGDGDGDGRDRAQTEPAVAADGIRDAADAPVLAAGAVPTAPEPAAAWRSTAESFLRRRAATIAAAHAEVRSATAVARDLRLEASPAGASDGSGDPAGRELGDRDPDVAEQPPWRRGRAGTGLGSAVHGVLQHVDLDDPQGEVAALARWQATVEGLPGESVPVIEAKARAALASPLVARAVASGRLRRELHVAAPVSAVLGAGGPPSLVADAELLEGFVDLCFEEDDGLVVVDYKTDDVPDDAAIAAAVDRYGAQGATYAVLLEAVTGTPVAEVHFLFLRGTEAVDAEVPDLHAATSRVRAHLARRPGPVDVGHDGAP